MNEKQVETNHQTFDRNLASIIDHTLLKPEAKEEDIERLCIEAKNFQFASVCVNPFYVKKCADLLKNTTVKICTVVSFPLGANLTKVKVFETEQAIANGANEIDMVINIGKLKSRDYNYVEEDISKVVEVAHKCGSLVKVIIETCLLTEEEKIEACKLVINAGADFVKTSTGFSVSGASADDVALIRSIVGPGFGIKASGGIRTREQALELVNKGANRIGTSSSVKIVKGE